MYATIPFTDPGSTKDYDSIVSLSQQLTTAPTQVTVTGYTYQQPTLAVTGSSTVSVDGTALTGTSKTWLYDHLVQDPGVAAQLAKVRAQEQGCWACVYSGSGAVPGLRAGYTFTLESHPVAAFNRGYLVVSVQHSARNLDQSWGTGSSTSLDSASNEAYYSNQFTLVPSGLQFRPRQVTPRPQCPACCRRRYTSRLLLPPSNTSRGRLPSPTSTLSRRPYRPWMTRADIR